MGRTGEDLFRSFFPWRRYVAWGVETYWTLVTVEAVLLLLYICRIRLRATAAMLALFIGNLGSFLNHRFLMSLELFLVSLCLSETQCTWCRTATRTSLLESEPGTLADFGGVLLGSRSQTERSVPQRRNIAKSVLDDGTSRIQKLSGVPSSAAGNPRRLPVAGMAHGGDSVPVVGGAQYLGGGPVAVAGAVLFQLLTGALIAYIWIFALQMVFVLIVFLPDHISTRDSIPDQITVTRTL